MPNRESSEAVDESLFEANDGARLQAFHWSSPALDPKRGALVVLAHGYAEHAQRYREFASVLVGHGHRVACFDARGHGRSPGQRGDIASFERYVDDLHGFMLALQAREPARATVLLGHSMGGLVALRTVQTKRPSPQALVLVSPLIALRPAHQPMPLTAARLVARLAGRLPLPNGLDPTELSHDPEIVETMRRDRLSHHWTTPRWYVSAHDAMAKASAQLAAITLPLLVVRGELDPIADPSAIERMAAQIPSRDKHELCCRGAFHEVLNETDRAATQRLIARWISDRFGSEVRDTGS